MRTYEYYIKGIAALCIITLMLLITEGVRCGLLMNRNTTDNRISTNMDQIKNVKDFVMDEKNQEIKLNSYRSTTIEQENLPKAISPRMVSVTIVQRERIPINFEEKDVLYRIVQAEAGGEDALGKKMVADVILNRVLDERFPNTVREVVFQRNGGKVQFAPTKDGRFYSVQISNETMEAVDEALIETDYTDGALYFVATSKASKDKVSWFEKKLNCKGKHGGHTFYQ